MTVVRGTTNGNVRGSAADRRKRKLWLLAHFGDGISTNCSFCDIVLLYSTLSIDRHPTPGCDGGKYVRGNIRPACLPRVQ